MNDKEGKVFIERAEKMVARLTKALYADDEDDNFEVWGVVVWTIKKWK